MPINGRFWMPTDTNALWLSRINTWVLVTAPLEGAAPPYAVGHDINTLIGYSWLCNGDVIHIENVSPLQESLAFNGRLNYPDGYYLRPFYPFLVSLLSWLLGLKRAALAINYGAFGCLVVGTAWLARQLSGRRSAALIAGSLAATSVAVFVHLNDLSPHLFANAVGALAAGAIYASGVWRERQPWIVHFRIGLLLWIATLSYPSGALLAVGYLLTAIWYSQIWQVMGAAGLAFLARPVWGWVLARSYVTFLGLTPAQAGVADFSYHATLSQDVWLQYLHRGLGPTLIAVAKPLADCLFVSFPLLALFGLGGIAILGFRSPKHLRFLLFFTFLPWLGASFFSPAALARGYIAVNSAAILIAAFAAVADRGLQRNQSIWKSVIILMVACQLMWSLSYMFGYFFPIKAFFIGYYHAPHPLVIPEIHNLTGAFPLWRQYGGSASFIDAGGLRLGSLAQSGLGKRSVGFAITLNGFMLLAPLLLAATALSGVKGRTASPMGLAGNRRPRPIAVGFLAVAWPALTLLVAGLGYAFQREILTPFAPADVTDFAGLQPIRREIDLSPTVVSTLKDALRRTPGLDAQIVVRGDGFTEGRFQLGAFTLPVAVTNVAHSGRTLWHLAPGPLLAALQRGPATLRFAGVIKNGMLGGWQRGGVPGQRAFPPTTAQGVLYLPSFELRLYDPARNSIVWLGY
jgi:hypothetical protein